MRREVFISYSHKDAKHLTRFLVPFERECGVTVWDDQNIQPGSPWESEIAEALSRAKVAVLLVTANFMASPFVSQSELPTILQNAQKEGLKILWVAVSASAYKQTEIARYQAANDPARPLDTMPPPMRRKAWVEIAQKIFDAFEGLHPEKLTESALRLDTTTTGQRRSILLAQTTDDAEDEADQLRSYLQQYDEEIAVLPAGAYPQGGEAFRAAFEQDLAHAELFVQLLGHRAGRLPPDLPEGYTRYQLDRAKAAGIPIMQWRHPELDVSAVTDGDYKKILTAETVVASGLEAFKRQILNWSRKPKPKPRTPRYSTVFINANELDLEFAKEIEKECVRNALTAILPMRGPSSEAEAIRTDLEERLTDCDVLVFIYGNTTQGWIRSQLLRFNKVRRNRESPPKLLAICSGPPPKPEIGISFPDDIDPHLIECPEGWNLEPIRKLISELGE